MNHCNGTMPISTVPATNRYEIYLPLTPPGQQVDILPWRRRDPHLVGFKDQSKIGCFMFECDAEEIEDFGNCNGHEQKKFPRALPMYKLAKFRGTALDIRYEDSRKISNMQAYFEQKQRHFFQWLIDNEYFYHVRIGNYKKPDFICNAGRIVTSLMCPLLRSVEWEMHAVRFNDTIFMSDLTNKVPNPSLESHCGYVLKSFATGGDPYNEIINETMTYSAISEVTLGPSHETKSRFASHQLLVVDGIDALDDQSHTVRVRAYNPLLSWSKARTKFLKFWAINIVPGVQTMILGHRNKDCVLERVELLHVEELLNKAGFDEMDANRCYEFEHRLLTWIKSQFKENDRRIIKKFDWPASDGSPIVTCSTFKDQDAINILSQQLLPDWFVRDAFGQL